MSAITTHVLDTATGQPAQGIAVSLAHQDAEGMWSAVAVGETDVDGRVQDLLHGETPTPGTYRLRFAVGAWFANRSVESFYPHADVAFIITDPDQHYHVPLLLSPFGYSTYRGS